VNINLSGLCDLSPRLAERSGVRSTAWRVRLPRWLRRSPTSLVVALDAPRSRPALRGLLHRRAALTGAKGPEPARRLW